MWNPRLVALFVLVIAVSGSRGVGQDARDSRDSRDAAKPRARSNVVIVGASVSAGFADPTSKGVDGEVNRTYRLDEAFKKAWPRSAARIVNYGDMMMFMQPVKRGKKQLERAKKRKVDLLLGIDFLTWFGYGSAGGNARAGEVNEKRMAVQAEGLALLAGFPCPMVLGDYPDMHGASSHMLPGSMIPNLATLAALNKRLRAWAKKRKNVYVLPLAAFVRDAVSKKQVFPFGKGKVVELPRNFLLQSDRLHATRIGTLVIVLRVTQALRSILPAEHRLLRVPAVSFQTLVETAHLEDEIPDAIPIRIGK